MAASKQTSIHTHVRNAVTLVWGSLRLVPMIFIDILLCIKWKVFRYVYTNSIVSPTWIYQLSEHPLVPACSDK